jgi:uncharacterized protein (TIGR00251 family)
MKLWVKVIPRSERFAVENKDGEIIVRATEVPEKGRVNTEIVKELGRLLKRQVTVVRGLKDRKKLLEIEGDDALTAIEKQTTR